MKTFKTESFAEYLARGGKVTICPAASNKKSRRTKKVPGPDHDTRKQEAIDMTQIPMALRISLGMK